MKYLSALIVGFLLIGCKEEKTAQSVEWYKTHDKDRIEKIAECKLMNEPWTSADCRNADEATPRKPAVAQPIIIE